MKQIGRYELQGELGAGGFGSVYRAYDPFMRRPVAIKLLTAVNDPTAVFRFRVEAGATGKLHHKNIVTVYDYGEHEGTPYLVMQLVEGSSLKDVIDKGPPLSVFEKTRILQQVAEGLQYAHDNAVIHRDIKPANIMLLPDGSVKILDFGIARLMQETTRQTKTGMIIGTVEYMAPELIQGKDANAGTDIWSFGVTAYELIAHRHPFRAPQFGTVLYNILSVEPPRLDVLPGVPPELATTVATALIKSPAERFQSFEEVLLDLAPIELDLRKKEADRLADEVEKLADAGEIERAQAGLLDLLNRLDPGHKRGRELRKRLQRSRDFEALQARVGQAVRSAEALLEQKRFEQAVAELQGALQLTTSEWATTLREDVQRRLDAARDAWLAARLEAERVREQERRRAEERRRTEAARIAEEQRRAEAARVAEEQRRAEAARIAEEQRRAEAERIAEEQRRAEAARIAEEQRRAEAARIADEQRRAEAARMAEEQRRAEAARIAEEQRRAEAARMAEEQRRAEAARMAEEQRRAEAARIAEEQRRAEAARMAEEQRRAEAARMEEEQRLAARVADQRRSEQERGEDSFPQPAAATSAAQPNRRGLYVALACCAAAAIALIVIFAARPQPSPSRSAVVRQPSPVPQKPFTPTLAAPAPGQKAPITSPSTETHAPSVVRPQKNPAVVPAAPSPAAAPPKPAPDPEEQDWKSVEQSRDAASLRGFIAKYPNSRHHLEAQQRVEELAWQAVNSKDPAALEAFARLYPDSPHAAAALADARRLQEQQQTAADQRAIMQTLGDFSRAIEQKDAARLRTVWPTIPNSKLNEWEDVFKNARSARMELRPESPPQIEGPVATVACRSILQKVFEGQGQVYTTEGVTRFTLRKQGSSWVIASVR